VSQPVFNVLGDEWDEEGTRPGWEQREVGVGRRLGGEMLGATLYELAPGAAICPYHEHAAEEEMALVVAGRVNLRGPNGEQELAEGDLEVFLRGSKGGHLIRNVGDEPARVLMVSTLAQVEVCRYPDSGKVGVWGPELRLMGREAEMDVEYFEGEDY
jgi:uncharacterized cupin superfamily protein